VVDGRKHLRSVESPPTIKVTLHRTMNSFALLYLFYSAKLGSQATIYFIWLVDSSSRTIPFIAAAVAIFAIFPFFHVIVHICSSKPLSNPTFIAYLCFR
jgi:hypothetical protein